ncbi:hypothetical protein PEC18_34530 [Paucibacter sp. O1-1]|nr:hypothetical protein [Paucibacter sp. O1-1]MDA3830803.1 hypothetical protein [Paucibacter sp. O1-1]
MQLILSGLSQLYLAQLFCFLCAYFVKQNPDVMPHELYLSSILSMGLAWFVASMLIFRVSLLDTHETSRLIFYKQLSRIIGLPLTQNIEYS